MRLEAKNLGSNPSAASTCGLGLSEPRFPHVGIIVISISKYSINDI